MKDNPHLIFIMGLPGSGKTHLAKLIADRFTCQHVSSDQVRRDLGLKGHYAIQDKLKVYEAMKQSTKRLLAEGEKVVVDSTFSSQVLRDQFFQLSKEWTNKIYWILTTASDEVIKKRVAKKRKDSEADYSVYLRLKNQFDPINVNYLDICTHRLTDEQMLLDVREYCNL